MSTSTSLLNVVMIDTGPPGPHSGYKILRVANVEGGSGDYTVTWRPICDLTDEERQKISCSLDYRDEHPIDTDCSSVPPCTFYDGTPTCCRTGNCGGPTVYTRYHTGETDRELVVTIENIPQFAQNVSDPACQLIFHWTLVDNVTGDQMDGCCGVVFQWKVITPAPLVVPISGCNTTTTIDTSEASGAGTAQVALGTISGGIGPYEITWEPLSTSAGCFGTFSHSISEDQTTLTILNENVPQFSHTPTGATACTYPVRWTVRDTGLVNEFGAPIGRVETGICVSTFRYEILNPPAISAEVVGCNAVASATTGLAGPHSVTHTMQIGDISGGSGNYTVEWNTTPTIMSGQCVGDISAVVNGSNPRLLEITASDVPQFYDNHLTPCVRAYTATITDNTTGVQTTTQCQVSFSFEPTDATGPIVTLSGAGQTLVADTGTCSTSRVVNGQVTITSITGGTGSYDVVWGSPTINACSVGSWTESLSSNDVAGIWNLSFTGNPTANGTCTVTRDITVTDTTTGKSTTVTCTVTGQATRVSDCSAVTAITNGCGQTVNYANHVGASGTTSEALLDVSATGGSGNYTITWNTTPTSVTGTCYGTAVTSVTSSGTAGKTLHVSMTGIDDDVDNSSTPCVRTYQYTITDNVTGQVVTGSCSATFKITQETLDCAITSSGNVCGSGTVLLTAGTPSATRTMVINNIAGGFVGADYVTTWTLTSACGGRVKFQDSGTPTLTTTTSGTSASAVIEFEAPLNQTGSCTVVATAVVRSTDPGNPSAVRQHCATISCTYNVSWNTQVTPSGTIGCGAGAVTLNYTTNSVSRTYTISGAVNTSSISWNVAGCTGITVTPRTGTGNSITITYTASNTGAGMNGSCTSTVTATLTGPGGAQDYTCSQAITYDTRPPAISITSISNCGQTKNLTTATRSGTFAGMTINHTTGAGGPYVYEWTKINQTGTCTNVTYAPATAATQTLTPTVSVSTNDSGSCAATYQARVRDSAGIWSAPVTCTLTTTYPQITIIIEVFNYRWDFAGAPPYAYGPFEVVSGFAQLSQPSDPALARSVCTARPFNTDSMCPPSSKALTWVQLTSTGAVMDLATANARTGALLVRAHGGVAPYTLSIKNMTKTTGTVPSGECIAFPAYSSDGANWGAPQIQPSTTFPIPLVHTMQMGADDTTPGVPVGSHIGYVFVEGKCGSFTYDLRGTFDVVITDATGATVTYPNIPYIFRKIA